MPPTLNGQRVAVTGATGFIGARLAEKLASGSEASVSALVRNVQRAKRLTDRGVPVLQADLGNRAAIAEALRGNDVVINTVHDFRASERRNVQAFSNLLDGCVAAGVKRLVHTSTIVVYDDWPHGEISEDSPRRANGTAYKNAKVAMEEMAFERASKSELSVAILQPTIVYGPQGWIWTDRIVEQLQSGTVVLPTRCDGHCHAVYVDDVVDALTRAASARIDTAESFIVSGPEPVSWRQFFESYDRMIGANSIRYLDLESQQEATAGSVGRLESLARNPLQIAQVPLVRALLGFVQRAIGDDALARIRAGAMKLNQKRGPVVHHPSAEDVDLYRARGVCHIEKARRVLGYSPSFDFGRGMELTAEHVVVKSAGAETRP